MRHRSKFDALSSGATGRSGRTRGSSIPKTEIVSLRNRIEGTWTRFLRSAGFNYDPARNIDSQPVVGGATIDRLAATGDARMIQLASSRWLKVKSIVEAETTPVYDISVDEVHNFVVEGVVVHNCFQEQLMRLGAVVAGFDAKSRGKLRKAVAKKKADVMAEVSAMFRDGAQQEFRNDAGEVTSIRFNVETADRLLEAMKGSAEYLFNASHSAAYAQVSYITAYLKANWPAEYGAAILATTKDKERRLAAMDALRNEGIEILPPDVNKSQRITSPEGTNAVRIGLAEIDKVGQLGAEVVELREKTGIRFTSLGQLITRLYNVPDKKAPSIANIEGLIESGAMDEFGPRLGQLMVVRAVRANPNLPIPDAEFGVLEKSMRQRARLGVSLGEHPLKTLGSQVKQWCMPHADEISDRWGREIQIPVGARAMSIQRVPDKNYEYVMVAGLVAEWTESSYSRGRRANITLEGSNSRISGVMWDDALKLVGEAPPVGSIVAAYGQVAMREREIIDEDTEEVIERQITKELTFRRVYPIEVDNLPVGSFMDMLHAAPVGEVLPPVPQLKLLKLTGAAGEVERKRNRPPAVDPKGVPVIRPTVKPAAEVEVPAVQEAAPAPVPSVETAPAGSAPEADAVEAAPSEMTPDTTISQWFVPVDVQPTLPDPVPALLTDEDREHAEDLSVIDKLLRSGGFRREPNLDEPAAPVFEETISGGSWAGSPM